MQKLEAIHYGEIELIPGIKCDGYVLSDGTACLSENGVAKLLGIQRPALRRIVPKWPPKTLKPFIGNVPSIVPKLIKVTAKNSPYQGRNIVVYDSHFIESFIRGYALALANDVLRPTQIHIGKRSIILQSALIITALESAIKQACGLNPNIQKIAQKVTQMLLNY